MINIFRLIFISKVANYFIKQKTIHLQYIVIIYKFAIMIKL